MLLAGSVAQAGAAAVAALLVYRLLGPGDSGLYSLVIVPANIIQLFVGLGVSVAVTRNVAYYNSVGETEKAVRISKNAVTFVLLTGLVLGVLAYVASGQIAGMMLHRPSLAPYVGLISVIIAGQALLGAGVAAAIGWNAMGIASLANVTQGVARMVASPLLVVIGLGLGGAVIGYAASYVLAGLAVVSLLFMTRLQIPSNSLRSFAADVRGMVRFGFPPYIGGILSGLASYYVPLVLAVIASNATIGYYTAANTASVPISLVSSTAAAALFPAFAGLVGVGADTAKAFRRAVKYVGYISIPIVFFIVVAAKELMALLFGAQFLPGTTLLVLLSLTFLPVVAGSGIIPTFFNGMGRTRITLYVLGSSTLTLFVLAPLLGATVGLGVDGTILAILISNVVLTATGLWFFRKLFSSSPEWRPAAATLCAGVAGLAVTYAVPVLPSDIAALAERLAVFSLVYLTLGPTLGAVSEGDLEFAQAALGEMAVVSRLLRPFFRYQLLVAARVRGGSDGGTAR